MPYVLFTDPDGEAGKRFGIGRTLWLLSGRVTFVVNKDGIVTRRFSSQFRAKKHLAEALEGLRELRPRE